MRKITLSIVALIALSSQSYAGGDILPLEENATAEPTVEVVAPAIKVVEPEVKELKEEKKEVAKALLENSSKKWYAGAGLTAGRTSTSHCEDITYGVMAKVGYHLHENVDLEARGLITNWEYEGSKIQHLGAFIKPQYPINENMNLYGLLGYAKTTTSHVQNVDETGLAYGAGMEYQLKENMNLFIDYERLLEKSDMPDLDALSLGVSFGF